MYARHELVWLQSQAWQAVTPGAQLRLAAWFAAGHPAVVARRQDHFDRMRSLPEFQALVR